MYKILSSVRGRSTLMGARLRSRRSLATAAPKKEGDISDSFASLSGLEFKPLEPRFAELKKRLIAGHEDEVQASWERLLGRLREEIPIITSLGPKVIPEIDYQDIDRPSQHFTQEHKKRGVAIVRNVMPEQEALGLKEELRNYIRANPQTKAFPPENPQVYELYWSPTQMKARGRPNLMNVYKFLLQHWHSVDPTANISVSHPTIYADRLRMRSPGDSKFALGPHIDGGSCERWEEGGYGLGKVYDAIFQGRWEDYDPWEISCRLPVKSDLYNGQGACSMFRAFQGWLSMSECAPFEGTLLVNPLLGMATSYYLLRPFFTAKKPLASSVEDFLSTANWSLQREHPDSWLQGATPGHGQELRDVLHPHLRLDNTMVHVPKVRPGDYVSWHCDTIHAVDSVHMGKSDSSVLYIPTCPLSELNAECLLRQRSAFLEGTPGPDFPGGVGESRHVGRSTANDVAQWTGMNGMRGFGLESWDSTEPNLTTGQREVMDRANKILGFYP